MAGLEDSAFGRIRVREILGAEPGAARAREMLAAELAELVGGLAGMGAAELRRLREQQLRVRGRIGSRPGSMALPQEKIRAYEEFSARYVEAIERAEAGARRGEGRGGGGGRP